ncbi:ribosomal protein L7/L12 [Actinoplanes octamycinicus]|uniref:Ribosomal protein L7/L12 n=1 Tax=Actinoplanes octamycinicus TaxID=135948 RepID=A0A7W7H3S4_9ACTN|nr:ribosomal protein L7/L12 [Actinoplanes octamycinicus]MBB4743466.1 ribosomal protein L7/L12 [Actinoplanes octamycinicus]GIE62549.1 hypothetical protein Aoc01nite_79510 [Actinoplanes octamycinicus]
MDYTWAVLVIGGVAVLTTLTLPRRFESRWRAAELRLAVIERNLSLVMDHLGVAAPEPEYPTVVTELLAGRKIAAIKEYRDVTGAGLAEAKEAVELLAVRLGLPGGR